MLLAPSVPRRRCLLHSFAAIRDRSSFGILPPANTIATKSASTNQTQLRLRVLSDSVNVDMTISPKRGTLYECSLAAAN